MNERRNCSMKKRIKMAEINRRKKKKKKKKKEKKK